MRSFSTPTRQNLVDIADITDIADIIDIVDIIDITVIGGYCGYRGYYRPSPLTNIIAKYLKKNPLFFL